MLATEASEAVETVSAASVEPIYARFGIRSTAFCNFISPSLQEIENELEFGGFPTGEMTFICENRAFWRETGRFYRPDGPDSGRIIFTNPR